MQDSNIENMKIEHITYEKSRGATDRRPTSASRKVRDFFSSYPSYAKREKGRQSLTRPATAPSSSNVEKSSPGFVKHFTEKQMVQKQRMKEQKDVAKPQLAPKISSRVEDKELPPLPKLRRKGKFSDIVKEMSNKLSVESSSSRRRRSSVEKAAENMAGMYATRSAIRQGKMERVAQRPGSEYRAPPSPPGAEKSSFLTATIGSFRPSHHRPKSSPNPSKLAEYIETGADIFDSTRREITKDLTGRFKPPFEHLNYHPFSRSTRKASVSSGSSSFFCAGEEPQSRSNDEAVRALKERQRQSWQTFGRRLSGEGTNPWVDTALKNCRLCRNRGVVGIRGLCEECERDFMRPQTYVKSTPSADEDEMVPIPPLKDMKKGSSTKTKDINRKSVLRGDEEIEPEVPIKEPRYSIVSSSRPITIMEPIPKRQSSQRAAVIETQNEEEEVEKYLKWQTGSMRAEYDRAQVSFERWSDFFGPNGVEFEAENEDVSSVKGDPHEDKEPVGRNSGVYGYWDDVLVDYGAAASKEEGLMR